MALNSLVDDGQVKQCNVVKKISDLEVSSCEHGTVDSRLQDDLCTGSEIDSIELEDKGRVAGTSNLPESSSTVKTLEEKCEDALTSSSSTHTTEFSILEAENLALKDMLKSREEDFLKVKDILDVGANSIQHLRDELAKLKCHYKTMKKEKTEKITILETQVHYLNEQLLGQQKEVSSSNDSVEKYCASMHDKFCEVSTKIVPEEEHLLKGAQNDFRCALEEISSNIPNQYKFKKSMKTGSSLVRYHKEDNCDEYDEAYGTNNSWW